MTTRAPRPASLSISIDPPWSGAIPKATLRPRPVPPPLEFGGEGGVGDATRRLAHHPVAVVLDFDARTIASPQCLDGDPLAPVTLAGVGSWRAPLCRMGAEHSTSVGDDAARRRLTQRSSFAFTVQLGKVVSCTKMFWN